MLWVNACLQHRILGFVNRTTVRHLLALLYQFGLCDHEDASSEGHRDESHLMPRPHTAWLMAASLQQFGWECLNYQPYRPDLAPSDFHLYGPLKMHVGGHRFQNGAKVQLTVVPFTMPTILCWKHTFTDNTLWQMPEPSKGDYVKKQASVLSSRKKCHFEYKVTK
jgi:hypothetical protein